jgi:hypothetical protein
MISRWKYITLTVSCTAGIRERLSKNRICYSRPYILRVHRSSSIRTFSLKNLSFALINETNCNSITANAARFSCVKPSTNQAICLKECVSALLAIQRTRNRVGSMFFFYDPFTKSYKITRMKMLITLNGNGEDRRR